MSTEKDLYKKLCKVPNFFWQRIESTTGSGIPDLNGIAFPVGNYFGHRDKASYGIEFWVELKIGTPRLRPAQVAWHTRAMAQGRRVFVLSFYPVGQYCVLWKALTFRPIGNDHLTITNKPLMNSTNLEDVTSLLTTS